MTAVEYLYKNYLDNPLSNEDVIYNINVFEKSKKMEKQDFENRAIHFAEWLTEKHTLTLMALYEQFEEQFYNEEL